MAEKRETRWSQKDLISAIQAIEKENLSLRTVEDRFGVPKSTLNNIITIYMGSLKLVQNLAPLQS